MPKSTIPQQTLFAQNVIQDTNTMNTKENAIRKNTRMTERKMKKKLSDSLIVQIPCKAAIFVCKKSSTQLPLLPLLLQLTPMDQLMLPLLVAPRLLELLRIPMLLPVPLPLYQPLLMEKSTVNFANKDWSKLLLKTVSNLVKLNNSQLVLQPQNNTRKVARPVNQNKLLPLLTNLSNPQISVLNVKRVTMSIKMVTVTTLNSLSVSLRK